MALLRNKPARALIIIMTALVFAGILIAKIYYSGLNQSVDPRVKPARELYGKYNKLAQENNYASVFQLLDSVGSIYNKYPHYRDSYETGVLWNNRAAALITIALYNDSLPGLSGTEYLSSISTDSLFSLAEKAALKSIDIYNNWNLRYPKVEEQETSGLISPDFFVGLESYSEKERKRFFNQRLREIDEARLENPRRLSVAYTNLGLVYRHRGKYEDAVQYYKKALELWEDNLSAENNLNRLLGLPLRERNIIQKLFPRERLKSENSRTKN